MRRYLLLLLLVVAAVAAIAPALLSPAGRGAGAAVTVPVARQACPYAPQCDDALLVVGIPGLRWQDVGAATPALQALVDAGAVGVLSVKTVPAVTCRADGWLTLGAGNRAVAAGVRRGPCSDDLPRDLQEQQEANDDTAEGTDLAALSEALGGCVGALGAGPLLATGGLSRDGCPLVLAETPPVLDDGTDRTRAAVIADRTLARLLREVRPEVVLVVGVSAAPGADDPRLHVAVAAGEGIDPGALVSPSTRRPPYVQLIDVAPTVLDLLGVDAPSSMVGEPWRSVGAQPTPAALADLAQKAAAHKAVTVPFFVVLLAAQLVLVLLALWRRRGDVAELVALGGVAALGATYLANLVPWWRSPAPLLTLLAIVLVLSTLVTAAATAVRVAGRGITGPAGIVCGFTAAVILLDLVTGADLQMSSVAGYSPLVAGRFAGIGNVAFGVLAASVLLATAALTRSAPVVAAVAVLAVAVDGAPPWGSDVGGVLALVPGFVLLSMLLSGRRVSLLRLTAAGAAGAAVVAAFALADWSRRPAERTHLGRFVQDVVDGTAGVLLRRKAEAVLSLLFTSPVTALLPLVVAVAAYLVVRPPSPLRDAFAQAPSWRSGLLAVGLTSAIGFAVNDSGAAVPALALVVALPATGAVVLRARRARHEHGSLLA